MRTTGPLGRVAQRLSRELGEDPAAPSSGATSFLAKLLDLRESVEIARALGAKVPPPAPRARAREAEALRADMHARVATIARGVGETRVAGLPGVPSYSPVSLLSTLRVADAIDERGGRAIERATRMLWSPVTAALARRAARAQAELDAVFTDRAGELASLSGRAAYVLALDALLDRATDGGVAPLLDRPASLLSRRFARKLAAALAELPPDPTPDDVAALRPFLDEQLSRADALLRAMVEHRVRRAHALIDACCAVEAS